MKKEARVGTGMTQTGMAVTGAAMLCAAALNAAAGQPRLLAHRGGAHEQDENTMAAFKASYDAGLRGFETDFRMTTDNRMVILHDHTLEGKTDGKGFVEDKTYEELRPLRTKKTGQPLPTIEDFVAYFKDKPDTFTEYEMKMPVKELAYSDERLEMYCRVMWEATRPMPPGTYCFTSFDHRVLRKMREMYPDAPTGLIGGTLDDKQIEVAKGLKVNQIACVMDVTTRKGIREAQKAGFKVTGWPTVNEADYALGVALGCDVICTDIPIKLIEGVAKPK